MPWLFLIARAVYYQADRLVHMRDISMSMLKGSTTAARRFHESAPRSPLFEDDLCVQIAEMGLGCWGGRDGEIWSLVWSMCARVICE